MNHRSVAVLLLAASLLVTVNARRSGTTESQAASLLARGSAVFNDVLSGLGYGKESIEKQVRDVMSRRPRKATATANNSTAHTRAAEQPAPRHHPLGSTPDPRMREAYEREEKYRARIQHGAAHQSPQAPPQSASVRVDSMRTMAVAAAGELGPGGSGGLITPMVTSPVDGSELDWSERVYLYYAVYRLADTQHQYNGTESYEWLQEEVRRGEEVCNKKVDSLGSFSSAATCDGPTRDYNSEMTIAFKLDQEARVRMRMALNFGYGGALYLNGTLVEGKTGNVWWGAWWQHPDVFYVDETLAPGEYELKALGFEPCCDGFSHVQFQVGTAVSAPNSDRVDGLWEDLNGATFASALENLGTSDRLASQGFQGEVYIDEYPYEFVETLRCLQASTADPERVYIKTGCDTDRGFEYNKRWLVNKDGTIRNVLRSADGSDYACLAPTGGSAAAEVVLQLDVCDPGTQAQLWDWDGTNYRIKNRQNPSLCIAEGPQTSDGDTQVMLNVCPTEGEGAEGAASEDLKLNLYKMWCMNDGAHIQPEDGAIDQVIDSVCACPLHYIGNACELERPVVCTTTVVTSVPYDCQRGRALYPEYVWSRDSEYPPCRIVDSDVESVEVETTVECGWDLNSNHTMYPIVNTSMIPQSVNWTYWILTENGTLAMGDDPELSVRFKVFDFYRLSNENYTDAESLRKESLEDRIPWKTWINVSEIPASFFMDGRLYSEFGLSEVPPGATTRGSARYVFDFPHRRADTRAPPVDLTPLWITLGVLGGVGILLAWLIRRWLNSWLLQRPVSKAGPAPEARPFQSTVESKLASLEPSLSSGAASEVPDSPNDVEGVHGVYLPIGHAGPEARRRPRTGASAAGPH